MLTDQPSLLSNESNTISRVLHWFDFISAHPRPSGGESALVAAIRTQCDAWGLDHAVDDFGNLRVRKPAHSRTGAGSGTVLQAHLDMVTLSDNPVYSPEVDPIRPFIKDGWLQTDGTTLGADNGLGVAAILAVLEAKDIPHGEVEALFTVEEEIGLKGAKALQAGWLRGQRLINLDTEDDQQLVIGAAGGLAARVRVDFSSQTVSFLPEHDLIPVECTLEGLPGGHSGLDIDKGRPNAIAQLARILAEITRGAPAYLSSFTGGSGRNAIPTTARAVLFVPAGSVLADALSNSGGSVPVGLSGVAPGQADIALPEDATRALLQSLSRFSEPLLETISGGQPATSLNLGRVTLVKGRVDADVLGRYLTPKGLDLLRATIKLHWSGVAADIETEPPQAAWTPRFESPLLAQARSIYLRQFGKAPEILSLHAGLECAAILGKYPSMDAISIGPRIENAHTTNERAEIVSIARFWQFLVALISSPTLN